MRLSQNAQILPDPTGGFHPLVSIYYLVDDITWIQLAGSILGIYLLFG